MFIYFDVSQITDSINTTTHVVMSRYMYVELLHRRVGTMEI